MKSISMLQKLAQCAQKIFETGASYQGGKNVVLHKNPPLSRATPRSRGATLRLSLISDCLITNQPAAHRHNTSVDVLSELSPPELFL